jgi:hypothetical protein
MHVAHRRLTEQYERAGTPDAYIGKFIPGPHRFDVSMQDRAFIQLGQWLR